MCAIVDNDVRDQVFSVRNQSAAGKYFYEWLLKRNGGILVSGGKNLRELSESNEFRRIFGERLQAGRARRIPAEIVDTETETVRSEGLHRSDDEHVLALARVSRVRLLFTNDRDLTDDFRNRRIVGGTRGRVYTTVQYRDIMAAHRQLLRRTDLCDG